MSSKSTRALRRHQVNSAAFRRQLRFELFEARNLMAVYEVSSLDDSGPNTLRQAIVDANASAGDDSVVFNLLGSSPLTITLNSQIDVTDNVTVDGTTYAPGIKVSGGNSTRLFSVASGISFTIDTLTLSNGFTAGSGAAIYNLGTTIVSRSTFSGNHSLDDGGAIKNDGTLVDISNSTFSGNIASNDGGAIRNAGTLTIQDSTFANNQAGVAGGGVRNDGTLNITNTIVSSNIASLSGPDLFGTIVSGGYNLIESTNSLTVTGTTTGNILGTGALLGPLGDYGGPTQTHPISANSPAYNAGDPTVVTSDQRGQARIGTPDIGAFESERNRFFVTTNADSGVGTLRQAIADANFFTGTDTVLFKLGGPIAVISPVSALPSITESLVLDGTSQTGYAGSPLIELDGSNIVAAENGLYVNSSGSTIKGLSIVNWSFAGVIFNGSNNRLQSSYIGVHADGTTAGGNASG